MHQALSDAGETAKQADGPAVAYHQLIAAQHIVNATDRQLAAKMLSDRAKRRHFSSFFNCSVR
jgi:hypothetical protein